LGSSGKEYKRLHHIIFWVYPSGDLGNEGQTPFSWSAVHKCSEPNQKMPGQGALGESGAGASKEESAIVVTGQFAGGMDEAVSV